MAFADFFLLASVWAQSGQNASPPPPSSAHDTSPPGHGAGKPKDQRIKASVDLVVLHVTIADEGGQFVRRPEERRFPRFRKQSRTKDFRLFSREDIPVTMGLVIDNSGSMREKREQVNQRP